MIFFVHVPLFALHIARKAQGIAIRDCHYLPDNSVEKIVNHTLDYGFLSWKAKTVV
jgi:hypothetical protein